VSFAASTSGTKRFVAIRLNAVEVPGTQASAFALSASNPVGLTIPSGVLVRVVPGDYLELWGYADYASWATNVGGGSDASRFSVMWRHI
jgi:hypothetical protein